MGNSTLINEFKSGNWQVIQNQGNREKLQNSQTHMLVQKHFSMSNFKSFEDRFTHTEIYNWRKSLSQNVNIVKMYEFEIKQQRFGIQEEQYVYTQTMNRLNLKAKVYSKPEGFLLLLDLLCGLDILFQRFGVFNIDVFLLGVSFQGKGKVWLNQNLAKNYIQTKDIIENKSQYSQLVVVNNLVRIVKQKIFNQDFMPEVQFPNNMFCKQAILYIKNVRSHHVLLQVNKIYLDRDQFKEMYDNLFKQFTQRNYGGNVTHHLNQRFRVYEQPQKPLQQESQSFLKVFQESSETISSDSNSRSKTKKQVFPTQENSTQLERASQHQKSQIRQIVMQKSPGSLIMQQKPNIMVQAKQAEAIPYTFIKSQNYGNMQHGVIHENNIRQTSFISQLPQSHPIMLPMKRPISNNQVQYCPNVVQRRIVEYRTVVQQVPLLPRNFVKISQNQRITHQNAQQILYSVAGSARVPSNQFFKHNKNTPVTRELTNLPQHQFNPRSPRQQQKFIDNVQLCQSVVFDRGQLQRNLADLQK